ncbi:MAG: DHH family phosphoesterase, partial [Planctomycetota bacterium]
MPAFRPRRVDPSITAGLGRGLGIHPVTAQVLAGRGIDTAERARAFLHPDASQLHDPERLDDMDAATEAVDRAIGAGRRIAVYGDYDVDGVCGTALLVRALDFLGARTTPFIPHRVRDGYGLSATALEGLRREGCSLVVTVDNGTTRPDEIAQSQERGLDVVVTDHHEPGPRLPACPLVNPKRPGSRYPFSGLAGCGVALKLAMGLARRRGLWGDPGLGRLWPEMMALAALGTVADGVPLVDENRSLV